MRRDPEVPPYYQILNLVLIASAYDNWDDAEMYRLSAEMIYDQHCVAAVEYEDKQQLKLLVGLRKHLDELLSFKEEDMLDAGVGFGLDDGDEDYADDDDSVDEGSDDINNYNGIGDDKKAPEDAHNKGQSPEGKELELTLRAAGLLQSLTQPAVGAEAAAATPSPTINASSLCSQRCATSEGGAENAH